MEVKKMNTFSDNMVFSGIVLLEGNTVTMKETQRHPGFRTEIDSAVCHQLGGDTLKDALFIIDNIRENNMKITWSSYNVWSVQYKRRHVCDLSIENGSLVIGKVSEALITRVKEKSHNKENMMQLLDAMLNSTPDAQEAYALQ